jgi:hypothetical protein
MVCALVEKKVEMPVTNAVPNVPHNVVRSAESPKDPNDAVADVAKDPRPPPRLPVNGLTEIPILGVNAPTAEPRAEVPLTKGADVKALRADANMLNSPSNLFIFCF